MILDSVTFQDFVNVEEYLTSTELSITDEEHTNKNDNDETDILNVQFHATALGAPETL